MSCAIIRILTIQTPIKYGPIQVISQEGTDVTELCQYAWSTDSVCWTQWVHYKDYLNTAKNLETDFYLRVKLFGSFDRISINGLFTKCYNICLDNTNPFLQNFCTGSILFNPYANLDCALLMQQQLSDSIICMLGLPIYYFRVLPKEESAEFNFKEYVLHNIDSVKYIKLMIQDGTLPSSKPVFSDFDFDWENDWEVELSKTQFASAFGDTAFPKQRDLIYVPMMKRLYEVNSAYDEKAEGLMWRSTTWKLALVKYNDKTNVDKNIFEDVIDTLTVNDYDDVLGMYEDNEAERESGHDQIMQPKFAANNLTSIYFEDNIRKSITKDLIKIEKVQLNQKSNIIARNYYISNNIANYNEDEIPLVLYQNKLCYDSYSFSFIFNIDKLEEEYEHEIVILGNMSITIKKKENNEFAILVDDKELNFNNLKEGKTYLFWCQVNHGKMCSTFNIAEYGHFLNINRFVPNEKYYFNITQAQSDFSNYNNDWDCKDSQEVVGISPLNVGITNFKLYNAILEEDIFIKEIFKYSTNHENCIINDLARPLNDGLGYDIR